MRKIKSNTKLLANILCLIFFAFAVIAIIFFACVKLPAPPEKTEQYFDIKLDDKTINRIYGKYILYSDEEYIILVSNQYNNYYISDQFQIWSQDGCVWGCKE